MRENLIKLTHKYMKFIYLILGILLTFCGVFNISYGLVKNEVGTRFEGLLFLVIGVIAIAAFKESLDD